jgi:hypothetical protein
MQQPYNKVIREVFLDNVHLACETRTPQDTKLFNFDLEVRGRTWVILDNYGNEHLPRKILKNVFGSKAHVNLAVDRKTGELFTAHFGTDKTSPYRVFGEDTTHFVVLGQLKGKVPPKYLKKIADLLSAKRPFTLLLTDHVWSSLFSHDMGYRDVRDEIVVELDFRPRAIQIWGDCYREVSAWK